MTTLPKNPESRLDYRIVIPARMASQRLPGKPLAPLAGKTLLQHVHARALQSAASEVVIATDDVRIAHHAEEFGATVQMTSTNHQSGSDRIAEVVSHRQWPDDTIIVNLQGDEPLMPAACLDQVAALLQAAPSAQMASLYWPIESAHEALDSNVVKVVVSASGDALYFSRSVIPFPRDFANVEDAMQQGMRWLRHVGLYAYRAAALRQFTAMPASPLEQLEKLEQLRMLENGGRIRMAPACEFIPAGVDTPEDLARVESIIRKQV